MKVTLQQTEKLFTGGDLKFNSLGFSMLLTNLKAFHKMAPSMYTMEDCTVEINAFLEKFKATMDADCATIAKL